MARGFAVVAAFHDHERAERAAKDLERRGLPKRRLHLVRPADHDPARVAEMRSEMQQEVDESVAGPGVGLFTPQQAKGAATGTFLGGVLGAAVGFAFGALWAFAFEASISAAGRMAIATLSFMFAGAVIGFVVGGAMKPRLDAAEHPGTQLDERRLAGERDTLLEVHVSSEDEAHMVEDVLEHAGAERVDAIGPEGRPLPPQHEHPRPADPPEYWQSNGRRGG